MPQAADAVRLQPKLHLDFGCAESSGGCLARPLGTASVVCWVPESWVPQHSKTPLLTGPGRQPAGRPQPRHLALQNARTQIRPRS
eukprot:1142193-Pelagomonas_calceolata.AAC.4